MKEDIQGVPIL